MRQILTALMLVAALVRPAWAEIEIQDVTTPGGIKAWLVEERSIPFVALEIRFRGGGSLDAPGKRGATYLMTGLLEEGAGEMDAQAFAAAAESLAASFDYDLQDDALSVSARFLTENRDQAVDLLRQSLVQPRFDEDAIQRVRDQVLSGIRSDLQDPDEIVSSSFNTLAFGAHPYATKLEGTVESVEALTRDDILAAHAGAMARDRLYVAAVGDIGPEELAALLDRLLGDLPEAGAPMPGDAVVTLDGGLTVVPFDVPQSVAIFGHEGIARDDPDFFAAYLLNQVLGAGGVDSRLMEEVREKRGLTYGVYSYLVTRDHANLYVGRVASANDRIAEAVEVIRAEWARIAADGVTAEELDRAKTYLTGAYPLRFDGNGPIANILVGMQMEGLPKDYVLTRNDQVNAVTLEDVNRVARTLYRPEALTFMVVGQPQGLPGASN